MPARGHAVVYAMSRKSKGPKRELRPAIKKKVEQVKSVAGKVKGAVKKVVNRIKK